MTSPTTEEAAALAANLRRTIVIGFTGGGSVSGDGCGTTYGEPVKRLVNPDGIAAAEMLQRLTTERATLLASQQSAVAEAVERCAVIAEGCPSPFTDSTWKVEDEGFHVGRRRIAAAIRKGTDHAR